MARRLKGEGTCVYVQLIHTVVQQKPAQHHKASTLQLKKRKSSFLDGSGTLFILLAEVLSLCFIHHHHHVASWAY